MRIPAIGLKDFHIVVGIVVFKDFGNEASIVICLSYSENVLLYELLRAIEISKNSFSCILY